MAWKGSRFLFPYCLAYSFCADQEFINPVYDRSIPDLFSYYGQATKYKGSIGSKSFIISSVKYLFFAEHWNVPGLINSEFWIWPAVQFLDAFLLLHVGPDRDLWS